MRARVSRDDQPRVASGGMVPKLLRRSGNVPALVGKSVKRLSGIRSRCIRTNNARVAQIRELVVAAFAAKGTVDAHGGSPSVQVGLIAHALLVDHVTGAEAIEAIRLRNLMRFVAR